MLLLWSVVAHAEPPVDDGESLYVEHCASCHGKQGRPTFPGVMMGAGSFVSERFWKDRPEARLRETVVRGGEAMGLKKAMPAYADRLTDPEIDAVLAFIQTLRPSTGNDGVR